MHTLPPRRDHRKRHVEAAHIRPAFRRVRADIVWAYFSSHQFAFIDEWQWCVQGAGTDWRIRPDWRHRRSWDDFRREQLKGLSDRQVEIALQDLESLGMVSITHEGSQVVVCRIEVGARECVA